MAAKTLNLYKFHFIKTEDYNGNWHTYYPISLQKLNNLIQNSKNVYISKNKFLFYKEHNNTYRHQNFLLKEFDLIDIDGQKLNSKEECTNYFLDILECLRANNIEIEEIVCTNTTLMGFHLLLSPDCHQRFLEFLKNSPQRFERVDKSVFDTKRVRRLPQTYNGNRDSYSFIIPKDLNRSKIKDYLKGISPLFPTISSGKKTDGGFNALEIGKFSISATPFNIHTSYKEITQKSQDNALGMPLDTIEQPEPVLAGKPSKVAKSLNEADDNRGMKIPYPPYQNIRQAKVSKSQLPASFMVKEISNTIYGVNSLYCPVFKTLGQPSRRLVKRLQKANIGDLYVFKTHIGYEMISPKAHSLRRIEKIYKRFKCWKSLNELKFLQNWIYCSNIVDLKEGQILKSFGLLDIYEQDATGQYSKPHLYFLQKFYKKEYPNLIGSEKPKIYTAVFENA